jgi:hypothetical protein
MATKAWAAQAKACQGNAKDLSGHATAAKAFMPNATADCHNPIFTPGIFSSVGTQNETARTKSV